MKNIIQQFKHHFLPLCVIALVAMIISVRHLNEPPAYIHAWAQADNYALAIGFRHNGGDLFHPQTLIFNKQEEIFDEPESLITACDLPLHHWLAACLMGLFNTNQPWVFRGLTLAVAIFGLWALYLLAFVITRSRAKSLLVAILTGTAPSFAYYSASFLPTMPALSLALGGLLFYALHLRSAKSWELYVSLLLLTLATMTRTSFAVLWMAVACFQLIRIIRHETTLRVSWLPFFAGVLLYSAWWLWSLHLRHEYGSLFLGSLLPVNNLDEAREVMQYVHDRWRFHYFQRMQHWLYVAVAVVAFITLIINRKKLGNTNHKLSLWWLLCIWLVGEMMFAVAMFQQYCDHDYYFLDSFFLPIVMLLVGLLHLLPNPKMRWGKIVALVVVLTFTGFMTLQACQMQKVRRLEGVEALETAVRYKKANQMLEEAGFGSQELRFLTMFAYPQNLPFAMMDREGYALMWTMPKVVEHALTLNYDYILVEDDVYRREFEEAPFQVLKRLKRLAGNGEISVCILSDSVLHSTADHFFE